MRNALPLLILASTTLAPRADAATAYCVDSVSELRAALATAQANADDDYIYVEDAFYQLNETLSFFSNEPFNLILVGGYADGCAGQIGRSTLDGGQTVRPLTITTGVGRVLIQGFNIQNGNTTEPGGGLYFNTVEGNLSLQLNRFFNNRTTSSGGAVWANSDNGRLFVFNNSFYANRANQVGGMVLDQGTGGLVTNNTVYANPTEVTSVPAGILLKGQGLWDVSNNLVWNNSSPGGADFRADAPHRRRHNDIEFIANSVPPFSVEGDLSVEPRLLPCDGACILFDLSPDSPLIDAGSDAALENFAPGLVDLRGKPRTLGAHVDVGAYEFDGRLFKDGFE